MRTVSFLGQLIRLPSEQIVCCSLNCRCWQLGDWILHSEGLNLPGGNLPHNPPKKCPIGKLYFSEHTYTFMAEHATLISVIVSIILMFSTAMLHKHTFCLTSVHSYQFFFAEDGIQTNIFWYIGRLICLCFVWKCKLQQWQNLDPVEVPETSSWKIIHGERNTNFRQIKNLLGGFSTFYTVQSYHNLFSFHHFFSLTALISLICNSQQLFSKFLHTPFKLNKLLSVLHHLCAQCKLGGQTFHTVFFSMLVQS